MKFINGFILMVLLTFIATSGFATPVQWEIADGGNGHYYEIFSTYSVGAISWTEANNAAIMKSNEGQVGYLASITSEDENEFVSGLLDTLDWIYNDLNGFMGPWLGGSDAYEEKTWTWTTGESFSYFSWANNQSGETDDQDYLHYYVRLSENGDPVGGMTWNDFGDLGANNGGKVYGYVVEYDMPSNGSAVPEPSTMALFAIGLLSAISIGRKKMK